MANASVETGQGKKYWLVVINVFVTCLLSPHQLMNTKLEPITKKPQVQSENYPEGIQISWGCLEYQLQPETKAWVFD